MISRCTYDRLYKLRCTPKLYATELLLSSVGLCTSYHYGLDGIYLTAVQRRIVKMARSHGYEVGPG